MVRKTPILAGNWKMNKGPEDTRIFFEQFCREYAPRSDRSIWFFPPALSIPAAISAVRDRNDLVIGIQNIHWESAGAFTGEISAAMAWQAGVRVALAGHSERRHVFGESDDEVGRKVVAALAAGLEVIACVGETLEERQAGRLEQVLLRQINAAVDRLDAKDAARLCVAYEPVWAIGTGVNATPGDAAAAHAFVRGCIADRFGSSFAAGTPILYGGSVKPDNALALIEAPDVDGLLVGGASLAAESFAGIAAVRAAD